MSRATRVLIPHPVLEEAGFQCWQDGDAFEITKDGNCFGRSSDPDYIDKAVPILLSPMCLECWKLRPGDERVENGMRCSECAGYSTDPDA